MVANAVIPCPALMSGALQRLVTGVIGAAIAVAAIFLLPSWPFLALIAGMALVGVREYGRFARAIAPQAPTGVLYPLVGVGVVGFGWLVAGLATTDVAVVGPRMALAILVALAVALVCGLAVLLSSTPIDQAFTAIGLLSLGAGYLIAPTVSLYALRSIDPWLLFLLAAIIWMGDSAAYFGGKSLGRHKLAAVVSPKKTWEGAAFGLLGSVLVAGVWSQFRLGAVLPVVILAGTATAVFGQLGDLVESIMKRSSGIKDSGNILPGHGGILDRMDALFYGAVVLFAAVLLAGPDGFVPSP